MKPLVLFLLIHAAWFGLAAHASALTYDDWIASHALTGDDALPTADPDEDGAANLLEYALEGMDPTANDASLHPSMPELGWLRRLSSNQGNWEWVSFSNRATGHQGVWHTGLRWVARPGVEGICYVPQLSDISTLTHWMDGRCAFFLNVLPGQTVQAGAIVQGNRYARSFLRLQVREAPHIGDSLGGLSLNGLPTAGLDVEEPEAVQRAVTSASQADLEEDDLVIRRYTDATAVTDYRWEYENSPQNPEPATVTRLSSDEGKLTPDPDDPFRWIWQGSGSVTISLHTATSSYQEAVTTSTSGGQTVDEVIGIVTGSLRAHVMGQVDDRLTGKTASTAKPIFTTQNHQAGTYVRNAGCWVSDVDLTCMSPWNSHGQNQMAGTLVSPRHVILATHWAPPTGTTLRFVTADNTVVTRTLTGRISLPGVEPQPSLNPDITIGVLDSDVPGTIGFAKVLPGDWDDHLPTLAQMNVPVVAVDQEEKALVTELKAITSASPKRCYMQTPVPATPQRLAFFENLISGDSGNPCFMLVDDEPVLLCVWTGGGAGAGGALVEHLTAINDAMTTLGGGYQLTTVDLSAWTDFNP